VDMKRKRSDSIGSETLSNLTFGAALGAIVSVQNQREKYARARGLNFAKFSAPRQFYLEMIRPYQVAEEGEYHARFIVTNKGELWLSKIGRITLSTPHHSDMALNKELKPETVIAAGRFKFDEHGSITAINNHSGHYTPNDQSLKWVFLVLSTMSDNVDYAVSDQLTVEKIVEDTTVADISLQQLVDNNNYDDSDLDGIKQQIHDLNSENSKVMINTVKKRVRRERMRNARGLWDEFEETVNPHINDDNNESLDVDNDINTLGPR
jgi:hypothetical protein